MYIFFIPVLFGNALHMICTADSSLVIHKQASCFMKRLFHTATEMSGTESVSLVMNFLVLKSALAQRITLWKPITLAIIRLPAERKQGQTSVTDQTTGILLKNSEHSWVYVGNKLSEFA